MFKSQLTTIRLVLFLLFTFDHGALPIVGNTIGDKSAVNVCEHDPSLPYFCSCDKTDDVNQADEVTCYLVKNVTSHGPNSSTWSHFASQSQARRLLFKCTPNGYMPFIPSKVFASMGPKLREFRINGCELEVLRERALSDQGGLETVDLDRNEISRLEKNAISNLANLTSLSLSENRIETLPAGAFVNLPRLRELHLEGSGLEALQDGALAQLSALHSLHLARNKLTTLTSRTFEGLDSLREIDLFNNQIEALPDFAFSGSPQLRVLELSTNRIAYIGPKAFDGLVDLSVLVLGKNRLQTIVEPIFRGAPNLRQLTLSANSLTQLSEGAISDLVNVEDPFFHLYLKDNPWTCACGLLWMKELRDVTKSNATKRELAEAKCTVPKREDESSTTGLGVLVPGEQVNIIRDLAEEPSVRAACTTRQLNLASPAANERDQWLDTDNSILSNDSRGQSSRSSTSSAGDGSDDGLTSASAPDALGVGRDASGAGSSVEAPMKPFFLIIPVSFAIISSLVT